METVIFNLSYPFSWFVLILIIAIYLLHKKVTHVSIIVFIIAVIIGISITPTGSNAWLNSLTNIFNIEEFYCDEQSLPNKAILLPGGLTSVGKKVSMTNWTSNRIEALLDYQKKKELKEIFIPGGDIYRDRREGEYIAKQLRKMGILTSIITLGSGSYSTNSNILEIESLLNKNETYILFTSKWHAYRALKVASKQGIKICFSDSSIRFNHRELKEYPWNFKAAVREYLAILWYGLNGRI